MDCSGRRGAVQGEGVSPKDHGNRECSAEGTVSESVLLKVLCQSVLLKVLCQRVFC